MTFDEDVPTEVVVLAMATAHYRWVIVRYKSGRHEFFDYMDINHHLVTKSQRMSKGRGRETLASAMKAMSSMPVGKLANCSRYSSFEPVDEDTAFSDILRLLAGQDGR